MNPAWRRTGGLIRALTCDRKRLLLLNAVAWALFAAVAAGSTALSTSDFFCESCHVMSEHVDSHRRSVHGKTLCRACHLPEGAGPNVRLKAGAAARTIRYAAGSRDNPGPVEMPDGRCLAAGCHSMETLDAPGASGGMKYAFGHSKHRSRTDGTPMQCTTCHNRSGPQHMSVDTAACFLCHLRPGLPAALSKCVSCHRAVPAKAGLAGFDAGQEFSHGRFADNPESCGKCHGLAVRGRGEIAASGLPEGVTRESKPAEAHSAWPRDRGGRCSKCHAPVEHGRANPADAISADPAAVAAAAGSAASESVNLYLGSIEGEPRRPDLMFRRGVLCIACHPDAGAKPAPVRREACGACHARALGKIFEEQKAAFSRWSGNLSEGAERMRRRGGGGYMRDSGRWGFELRLSILEGGAWFHNIPLAREMVVDCESYLRTALQDSFAPMLLPDLETARSDRGCFWRCHVGVLSREQAGAKPLAIPHRRHVAATGIRCRRCHREERFDDAPDAHGKLRIDKPGCLACHHAECSKKDDCVSCHRIQDSVARGEGVSGAGVVRRTNCPEAGCRDCHDVASGPGKGREGVLSRCAACHKSDRKVTLDGWQSAVREKLGILDAMLAATEALAGKAEASNPGKGKHELAKAQIEAVRKDGSLGAHNIRYALCVLESAEFLLAEAGKLLGE